jgi:hypothetical protein
MENISIYNALAFGKKKRILIILRITTVFNQKTFKGCSKA